MSSRILVLTVSFLLGAAAPLGARAGGEELPDAEAQTEDPFQPPAPAEDEVDWIRLNSGEWLKGKLLRVRDGKLEFDSDELDTLTLDLDDVAEIRSPRQHTILLEGKETHIGKLLVKDGKVVLSGDDGGSWDRSQLLAIVPGTPREANYWSGKLNLGFTVRRGNTSQTDFTSYFFTRRETAATRWDTNYNGTYSETQSVEIANSHRLTSRFDYFLTHRLFVTPISATAFRDPFTNINVRVTPGAGFGYDLLDMNTLSWEVGGGPAYQYTRYVSVPANNDREEHTWAALLATNLEWDITPDAELKLDYQMTMPLPATHTYNHHFSTVLSVDLWSDLDLDLTLAWDRVNQPLPDENGVFPSADDLRISVGVGWSF